MTAQRSAPGAKPVPSEWPLACLGRRNVAVGAATGFDYAERPVWAHPAGRMSQAQPSHTGKCQ